MEMNTIIEIFKNAAGGTVVRLVLAAIVLDTIFGVLRAIKEKKFNSCFGIDGAIRKISMIISILALILVDTICHFNMIGFLPGEAKKFLGNSIGLADFFGVLYIAYEVVSILKNMTLCGLPVRKLWETVRKFLNKYTDELPDVDELDKEQTKAKTNNNKKIEAEMEGANNE